MLAALETHHIVDYSIHYYKPLGLIIANMKYNGTDYDKDMAGIAAGPATQKWWAATDSMQESLVDGATGSGKDIPWWLVRDHIFAHLGVALKSKSSGVGRSVSV